MEPHWWTIVVRAFVHEETESGLVIRLTRSHEDDPEVRVCGSVSEAVEQVDYWLTALATSERIRMDRSSIDRAKDDEAT